MKTKEQIIRHISLRSYEPSDWEAIVSWMKDNYGCGLKKARRPKFESNANDFFEWADNKPGDGDVVISGDMVGIFHEHDKDSYQLAAWMDNGIFHPTTIELSSCFTFVEPNISMTFYQILKEHGYDFSVSLGRLFEKPMPKPDTPFKFSYDGKEFIGIAKSIDDTVRFRILSDGTNVSLNTSIKTWKIDILPFRSRDIKNFYATLEQSGYIWDQDSCRLVSNIIRAIKGGHYWYINDKFGITEGKDCYNDADTERYRNRNYFLQFEEAYKFRKEIYKLRVLYQ